MTREFASYEDETLIEYVEKNPTVYDPDSPEYRDHGVKDTAWKEISGAVGRSVEECKWRWKNIKDTYNKRRRTGVSIKSKWHLAARLEFLENVQIKRKSVGGPCGAETVTTILEDEEGKYMDPPEIAYDTRKKRNAKKNSVVKNTEMDKLADTLERAAEHSALINVLGVQEDHVDVFYKSVAMSVKALPKHLISQAKLRTMQMLAELETECYSGYHSSSYQGTNSMQSP